MRPSASRFGTRLIPLRFTRMLRHPLVEWQYCFGSGAAHGTDDYPARHRIYFAARDIEPGVAVSAQRSGHVLLSEGGASHWGRPVWALPGRVLPLPPLGLFRPAKFFMPA